jgi:hypothetical protein
MRKKNILVTVILLITGFGFTATAQKPLQRTVSLGGSATCLPALTIANTDDMNFGKIQSGSTLGTVILTPAGTRTRTEGVTLPAIAGTVSDASFSVTGNPYSTYAITLPTTNFILSDGYGHSMIVNAFKSTPSGTGALNSCGAQTLTVGATLNVAAGQVGGVYENKTGFNVTIIYN